MLNTENIFLFSVQMLLGISLLLLVLTAYLWYITKDKTIGIYAVYVLACLCCAALKLLNIATGNVQANIMENTLSDELMTTLMGLVYIYFFGWVFEFNKGNIWQKIFWKAGLTVMILQIIYLLYITLKGYTNYFNPVITTLVLAAISLVALVCLVFAFTTKNKSGFQKIILAGGVVFYILILAGNLAEYFFKTGSSGFNMSFFALIVENIFFAIASTTRFKNIYVESEKLKIRSFQQQLETEQVINYFATSISAQHSIDDMLWDVTKNCISILGFEDCVIYLANDEKQVLIQKAAWGPKTTEENKIANPIKIPLGKGIVGAVALNNKAEIVNDTSKDRRYIVDDASRLSEISVPINSDDRVLGVIDSENSQKNYYTEKHLQVLVTIASLLANRIVKIKAEQLAKEKEIEVLKLNKDLATSQLTTLRAQMNPHFIFNALNSIQQYVLQGNVVEANKYLSKFSKLQREVLNHSDQNFISLEKELEVLNLYLELEQLRFERNFVYEIKMNAAIDADEIKIPPMIIQPFVENSIWHGLMPKQGERWVHIHFELSSDDLLVCTVTDNGIGRDASARLKQNGHEQHKSKGLSLVYDRLNILRQQYDQAFEVKIKDIVDSNNLPAGTEVKLNIYTG